MNFPKVTVLVLSYNGKHLLPDALDSYLANDYPRFEVAVIDNGSTDGTAEFVRRSYPQAVVLRTEKNLGYSGGLNLGLEYAFRKSDADYALVSNNDVRVDKAVITELVKAAEADQQIGFVTGKVYYSERPNILQTAGKKYDPIRWNGDHIGRGEADTGQYDKVEERYFADDIFTLVRKRLYDDIGGYDTKFFLQAEEYDWQARAKRRGYKIMYTPSAKIWHKESMTIGRISPLKAYFDARNPMMVVLIHQSAAFFRRYCWDHFRRDIVKGSLVSLRKGELLMAAAPWRGFISGIWWGIRNQKLGWRHLF